MRTDRSCTAPGDSSPKPCVSVVVPLICRILNDKGKNITEAAFRESVLYSFRAKAGMPQWFLTSLSDLTFIPSSKTLQRVHCIQHKAIHIYRTSLPDQVLEKLDRGKCYQLTTLFFYLQSWDIPPSTPPISLYFKLNVHSFTTGPLLGALSNRSF